MTTVTKTDSVIYLLPSESSMTIVQTHPQLTISALIPRTTKKALIDYFKGNRTNPNVLEFDLELPTLLWSQFFNRWRNQHYSTEVSAHCQCFQCTFKDGIELKYRHYNRDSGGNPYRFFVHMLDLEKSTRESVFAAPFSVANTDDGYVCWGSIPYPHSLRKSYNSYWQSVHNNSPNKYPILHLSKHEELNNALKKHMQEYKPRDSEWGEKNSFFLGTENIASTEVNKENVPQGVFISINPELRKQIPTAHQGGAQKAFIGFAYFKDDTWEIKNSETTLSLKSTEILAI